MPLNIGENFKQRWLNTPETVRQTFCEELEHISRLLEPETVFHKWQHQEALLQQKHRKVIEDAYELLKQELLAEQARLAEERRHKRQAEFEQKLNEKRAKQGLPPQKLNEKAIRAAQVKPVDEEKEAAKKALTQENMKKATAYYNENAKPGSLASKANMVKMFEEKNTKK